MNTGRIFRRIRLVLLILMLIPAFSTAGSARELLLSLTESPETWSAEITGQFLTCVPYSAERLQHLNDLIRHLQLRIAQGNGVSTTGVLIDGEEAFSVNERKEQEQFQTVFSFEPDTLYISETSLLQGETVPLSFPGWEDLDLASLPGQLTRDHLSLPDDAVLLIQRLPGLFSERVKATPVKMKLNDFGTAVQKIVITIPKTDAEEGTLSLLAEECENPVLRRFLSGLAFSGKQQFTLFLDEQGNPIRFLYSGQTGAQGSSRKVSLEWKMIRSEEKIRDEIVLKAPAVSGTEKDSLTFVREENSREKAAESSLRISFTYQRSRNKTKSAMEGSLQLDTSGENGSGSAELILGAGKTGRRKYSLDIEFSGDSVTEQQGTLRCAYALDQAEQVNLKMAFSIRPEAPTDFPETNTDVNLQTIGKRRQSIVLSGLQKKMAASLVRPLLCLPSEDLLFLNDELDPDAWENLRHTAHPSTEGGTHP